MRIALRADCSSRLARRDFHTQVVVDEFDSIRRFVDAQSTIQRLRDLIYRTHETGLAAVFIARRSLRAIEQSVADISTLDGVVIVLCGAANPSGMIEMAGRAKEFGGRCSRGRNKPELLHGGPV